MTDTPTPARADAPREAVRPAVACATWDAETQDGSPLTFVTARLPAVPGNHPALAIDGTAADIRERIRAALAMTDLVPIQNVEVVTHLVTRALGVQP